MRTMGYMPTEMELTELGQQIRMNREDGSGACLELGQGGNEKGVQVDSSTLNRKVVQGKELSARKQLGLCCI